MNPSDGLWRRVRAEQDRARSRAAYLSQARSRRGDLRPASRVRSRQWMAVPVTLAAVACVLAVLLLPLRYTRRDLRFSVGPNTETGRVGAWIAAPSAEALPLRFSDGTRFTLGPGARARVTALDAGGGRIVLERGHAAASVIHRPASRWRVDVGPFEVSVVGTRFDVSWDAGGEVFALELHEGAVFVSGPCLHEPRRIAQGQSLRVLCKAGQEELVEVRGEESGPAAAAPASEPAESAALAPVPPSTASASAASVAAAPPGPFKASAGRAARGMEPATAQLGPVEVLHSAAWRSLTSTGRYWEAVDLVEQRGFDQACRRASGSDLLELGDVARLAGASGRARQAYLAARGKLPGGGRSTYGLGLTAFDEDRDFALSARWFEAYLADQPAGELRREAAGRLVEAWQRAGNPAKAREAAEHYLRDYPEGTQAPLARQLTR